MNQKSIKEYIRALDHISSFLKTLLEEENKIVPFQKGERDRLSEITELRMLAKSDVWPEAVPPELICNDIEEEKMSRAAGIVQDFIAMDLKEKSFLDFGCGEGHVPYVAATLYESKNVVGYDIKNQDWAALDPHDELKFTTEWEDVRRKGPYDIILINDVLDHCKDPASTLQMIQEVKKPIDGQVFLRIHPWTSRHGSHLYKQLNKAYLHLVFTKDELYAMGLEPPEILRIINPIKTYKRFIKDAGFTILKESVVTQPVELFFTHTPEVLRRIKSNWRNSDEPKLASGELFPREILEIQFIDFTLI
jgi:2-polyprenyl-3-methyl-5-hydroxy-6-metoxy-1,4-benzoquinol methylase